MNFKEAGNDRDKLKDAIKSKWQEILEFNEEIGDDTSFFDIGGNSLTAGIVFAEIEEQLNIKIAVSEAYDYETASALADRIIELSGKEE